MTTRCDARVLALIPVAAGARGPTDAARSPHHGGVCTPGSRRRLHRCGYRAAVSGAGRGGRVSGGEVRGLARRRADVLDRMRLLADMRIAPRTVRFLRSLGRDVIRRLERACGRARRRALSRGQRGRAPRRQVPYVARRRPGCCPYAAMAGRRCRPRCRPSESDRAGRAVRQKQCGPLPSARRRPHHQPAEQASVSRGAR